MLAPKHGMHWTRRILSMEQKISKSVHAEQSHSGSFGGHKALVKLVARQGDDDSLSRGV